MATPHDWSGDFEALARQYWSGWNDMMRQAAGAQPGGSPFPNIGAGFAMPGFGAPGLAGLGGGMPASGGWQEALAQWSRLAQGMGVQRPVGLDGTINDTLARFQQQAGDWYGRMQQLAGELAGQSPGAGEIVERWRRMLEQNGEGAWLDMFRAMQSPHMHGFDAWYEAVQPLLAGWRNEARSWLAMPAFGVGREHQERLQRLLQAQLDFQDTVLAHNAMLAKSAQQAYANFEKKLAEREAPGREITSARALFDLWIDAAEDAFAEMALSTGYREAYGAMVNAQMRLRQDVQQQIEQATGLLGMPTRTEIESAHRKIAELERQLRRRARGDAASASAGKATDRTAAPPARTPRRPAAKKPPAANKTVDRKPAAKKTVAKKTAARKAPARKAVKRAAKRSR